MALQEYAARRQWSVVEIYQEHESAWKAGHQVQLARVIQDARRGRFEVLLVWALDRLSREGALAILSIIQRLGAYGVRVFSLQESWTEAPGQLAELLYAIAGWTAKMESDRHSERTKAGLKRVRETGVTKAGKRIPALGRPPGSKDKRQRKKRALRRPMWEPLSGVPA